MKIDIKVPDGVSGNWKVTTFTISEEVEKYTKIRAIFQRGGRGVCPAGTYKKITRNDQVIMSNTPDEIMDCLDFIYQASGNILINGLGLGVVLQGILNGEGVLGFKTITVIEKSEDVIKLCGPTYSNDKVKIIHADALNWIPPKGVRYTSIWHDIWDTIDPDNLPEMHKLHRKYGRLTKHQNSWCRDLCEKNR